MAPTDSKRKKGSPMTHPKKPMEKSLWQRAYNSKNHIEAEKIIALALDQARREGFEMARIQILGFVQSHPVIPKAFPELIANLKYPEGA
jgi:hypothetical protein